MRVCQWFSFDTFHSNNNPKFESLVRGRDETTFREQTENLYSPGNQSLSCASQMSGATHWWNCMNVSYQMQNSNGVIVACIGL